jgi:hypothetical protein
MDDGDRRDDLDAWLHAQIEPLRPPPGTFEMIRRRARRRRYRQTAVTAAVAAAVAAAVIVIPRVATSVLDVSQNPAASAAAAKSPAPRPAAGHGALGTSGSPEPAAESAGPALSAPVPPPVPADFAATSATFVGLETGWVIGQAGVPGQRCATQYCTSVARTDNAGHSWYGVPAPAAGTPDGASGVSQIRFLNTEDGWAFGPQLYATHDGGGHWTAVGTGGQRVIALETAGTRAFAIFATCGGTGPDFAARCTSFSLYSTPAAQNSWALVSPAVTGLGNGGQAASASLVLTSSRGYLLAPDGTLYSGPVSGTGSWQQAASGRAGSASCGTGTAQPDGQPAGAMLAAASPVSLALACAVPAASGGGAAVFSSADGGATWQASGSVAGSTVTSVAAQPGGEIIVATTGGLQVSQDSGATWQPAPSSGAATAAGPAGGFRFVGMTGSRQGVAVPENPAEHAVWFTFTGGQSWQRSPVAGA